MLLNLFIAEIIHKKQDLKSGRRSLPKTEFLTTFAVSGLFALFEALRYSKRNRNLRLEERIIMSKEVSFKDTLNLPRTEFPMRPNAAIDDPALIARWQEEDLYEKSYRLHQGLASYVLHDGPPYANGHLHLGHAYNGILKDIMTKGRRMSGFHTPLKPGWDCHGLPIEIKVLQEKKCASDLELKRACRAYASHWINVQREEFKRLGILMDWAHPYLTMDPSYESKTMRAFGVLLERNFIERKNKTVPWCLECKTVLAAAEIEYKDRKDPSAYVLFPFDAKSKQKLFPKTDETVSFLVWTTTPWTLPLNRAVCLRPDASYVLARLKGNLVVVGAQTLPRLSKMVQEEATILDNLPAQAFATVHVQPPFGKDTVPVIFDESVGLSEGTACVHIAPGCGPIDYELGVKNGLEIYSPITPDGAYDEGIYPASLKGMKVSQGQDWVLEALFNEGKLFYKTTLVHSYPFCWRSHTPLIFRATKQWFFNLQHNGVKERAVEAVDGITFMPPAGRNFLRATVESRWEWCLSRQRVWGVPIPALLCLECDTVYCTPALVNYAADHVAAEGVEFWDRVSVEEILLENPTTCSHCGSNRFKKEQDILDVWFDAGISHYAVLYNNPELSFPADLYLEGVDQHRGWFQSSLLTALALEGTAPMKAIMTHGFTVDGKGQKMSKSLGNVIAPEEIIKQIGTDGLRLWVASVGHEGDAVISQNLLQNVAEVYRKIRNTSRFLLSNLYDFDVKKDALPFDSLMLVDRGILNYAVLFNRLMQSHYASGHFTGVFHSLADFTTVYLSSWYLDLVKDRLYVESAAGHKRRSAQTVCWYLLDMLTKIMAPILSFTAEYLSDAYQKDKDCSIHLQSFFNPPAPWLSEEPLNTEPIAESFEFLARGNTTIEMWELLRKVRSAVLKAIEVQREKGLIKHSLEAHVTLYFGQELMSNALFEQFVHSLAATGQTLEDFFREFFIVSFVTVTHDKGSLSESDYAGLFAQIDHAEGVKCPRCWNWDTGKRPFELCHRCYPIVKALGDSPLKND